MKYWRTIFNILSHLSSEIEFLFKRGQKKMPCLCNIYVAKSQPYFYYGNVGYSSHVSLDSFKTDQNICAGTLTQPPQWTGTHQYNITNNIYNSLRLVWTRSTSILYHICIQSGGPSQGTDHHTTMKNIALNFPGNSIYIILFIYYWITTTKWSVDWRRNLTITDSLYL